MATPIARSFALGALAASCLLSGCAASKGLLSKKTVPKSISTPPVAVSVTDANAFEKAGQWTQARAAYTQLIEKQPNDADVLHRMAVVCTRLEDHAAAAEYYNRALLIRPTDAELLTDAGYGCYLRGEYTAAEELLNHALQAAPQHVRAANNLALVLGMQGRMDEAYLAFSQVQSREAALKNLSFVYQQRGEWPEAIACYRVAQRENPGLQIPQQLLAHAEPESKNSQDGVETVVAQLPAESPTVQAIDQLQVSDNRPASEAAEAWDHTFSQPEVVNVDSSTNWASTDAHVEFELPAVEDEQSQGDSVELASAARLAAEVMPSEVPVSPLQETTEVKVPLEDVVPNQAAPEAEWPVVSPAWPVRTAPPRPTLAVAVDDVTTLKDEPLKPGTVLDEDQNYFLEEEPAADVLPELEEVLSEPATDSSGEPAIEESATDEPAADEFEEPIINQASSIIDNHSSSTEVLPPLQGYCLVELADQRQLHKSQPEFAVVWNSVPYQFSSAEAAERFRLNPEKYLPAAEGLDVVAVRRRWKVIEGSLDHAAWFRNQLFLFSSDVHLQQFRAAPHDFVDM